MCANSHCDLIANLGINCSLAATAIARESLTNTELLTVGTIYSLKADSQSEVLSASRNRL